MLKRIRTAALEIAYEETGVAGGVPVVLLHGFPYDVRAYDGVAARLAQRCRVLVPYLRGYGSTRFLSSETLRSGQQAALAHVEGRAGDLAQPRPEYGHATNAFCIVGRRARTRGLFLDRRAFLVHPTQAGRRSETVAPP